MKSARGQKQASVSVDRTHTIKLAYCNKTKRYEGVRVQEVIIKDEVGGLKCSFVPEEKQEAPTLPSKAITVFGKQKQNIKMLHIHVGVRKRRESSFGRYIKSISYFQHIYTHIFLAIQLIPKSHICFTESSIIS